jgi:diguanylate cyclase (GGDEF)-like protein
LTQVPPPAKPLALIVDDDPVALELVAAMLEADGYRVERARDGLQALEAARRLEPRLVVTDWVMPEMDGLSLVRALRESRGARASYLIVLTALEDDEHLVAAFAAGADDYVTKPVRPRVLAARMRAARRIFALEDELREAAMTDALTGLPNRRHAFQRLALDWAAARRRNGPIAVILLDLDHFKRINDAFGHDAGDRLLGAVSQALRANAREHEEACRVGGEEFLVICAQAGEAEASDCAERLRREIERLRVSALPDSVRFTASLGVAAAFPAQGGDWSSLLSRADRALYAAKAAGRNRVACDPLPGG